MKQIFSSCWNSLVINQNVFVVKLDSYRLRSAPVILPAQLYVLIEALCCCCCYLNLHSSWDAVSRTGNTFLQGSRSKLWYFGPIVDFHALGSGVWRTRLVQPAQNLCRGWSLCISTNMSLCLCELCFCSECAGSWSSRNTTMCLWKQRNGNYENWTIKLEV